MKKVIAFAALCCVLFSGYSIAKDGYISVSASANKELAPDTVDISVAVVTSDIHSMQAASKSNKEISDKIYNAMKSMISSEDYVKTSDFRAQSLYNYVNNKRTFDKYEVSNRVIVHTKSIDKAGELIDKAILLGASNVDNLNFSISSYEKQCDELLSAAAQKASQRAEAIAKSSKSRVVGVRSIDTSCSTSNYSPKLLYTNMRFASESSMDSAGGATPVETGLIKLYANVNASYFVK